MKKVLYISLIIFVINALFFIFHYPEKVIFDDYEHLLDVKTYTKYGINIDSILMHGNESGVLVYWFWAIAGFLFGNNLTVYRLANFSILLLNFGIIFYVGYKNKSMTKTLDFTLLFFLSSIFASLIASLVLTESLSLFFFILTCVSLSKYQQNNENKRYWFLFLATICMGLCLITRFYQIALLGAVGMVLLLEHYPKLNYKLAFIQALALILGLIPLFFIVYLWKGIVPPIFKIRYPTFTSEIGLNLKRPLAIFLYIGIWVSPILILGNVLLKSIKLKQIILIFMSLIFFVIVKSNGVYIWNVSESEPISSGFIHFLIKKTTTINPQLGGILDLIFMVIGFYSAFILFQKIIQYLIRNFKPNSVYNLELFFFFYLLFYVLEQFFVSGNVPFYERYLILIYPSLGFLLYNIVFKQKVNIAIKSYLFLWIILSCINLWRYPVPYELQPKKASYQKVETK